LAAFEPSVRDPALAYLFYNLTFESDGGRVEFRNLSTQPGHYLGADGDFRNEAQVSALVTELGFDRCRELDREADAWRATHGAA